MDLVDQMIDFHFSVLEPGKGNIKMAADCVSGGGSLLVFQIVAFLLWPKQGGERKLSVPSYFYKDTNLIM